eukprot:s662_g10.t1
MDVQIRQLSDIVNHQKGKQHQRALEKLLEAQTTAGDNAAAATAVSDSSQVRGIVSGLPLDVPRLDTWLSVLNGVLVRASFATSSDLSEGSLGPALPAPDADGSKTVSRKIIQCLRNQLDQEDLWHLKHAKAASISLDKGGSHLVVHARILSAAGIYDMLLGIDKDVVPDNDQPDASRAVVEGLRRILKRAATEKSSSRRLKSVYYTDDDRFDDDALRHFCSKVLSLVADGCPTEQRALFECSALGGKLVCDENREPLFPAAALITRDRAHRLRSVDKLFWKKLPTVFRDFLDLLITGDRSLAKLLETSDKFATAFLQKQAEAKRAANDVEDGEVLTAFTFSKLLRSFSFADQRFDSRKKPLFKMFKLFVLIIDLLEDVSSVDGAFDKDDQKMAASILSHLGGDQGYNLAVSAAVAADALLIGSPMLRVCDASSADFALSAECAAKTLFDLKHFLKEGALWMPQADGTLTHSVLAAIRDRTVFIGRGGKNPRPVSVRWPAPDSESRLQPVKVAREPLGILQDVAFMTRSSTHLPGLEWWV